jgi:hypothetical protein
MALAVKQNTLQHIYLQGVLAIMVAPAGIILNLLVLNPIHLGSNGLT